MQQTPRRAGIATEQLRARWEAFRLRGEVLEGVRPEIAASWRRSAAAKLPVELTGAPIDAIALRETVPPRHTRQQFLAAAARIAERLIDELADTPAVIVVCDDFGVVLLRAGRPETLQAADRVNLVPGGVWSERTAGTNGVGLALALGATAYVHGAEHYLEALHGFSCGGAIVRHPVTREPLGALGLIADAAVGADVAQPLVTRAARKVEQSLEDSVFGRERELMEHYLRHRTGHGAPLLAVDRAGHTVIQDARMLRSATGEDIQLLLGLARHALSAERDTCEPLELSRGRSQATVEVLHGDGEILGALVSIARTPRERAGPAAPLTVAGSPLIGRSPAMARLFREAARVARQRMTVAIHGEPGTGKLMLAEHLHELGGGGELRVVHCARPEWEAEWERAIDVGGSLVLRRVHALSLAAQLRLCDRFDELADSGRESWVMSLLNADATPPCPELATRLARVTLSVPALRDRGHDLRLLVEDWCESEERASGVRPVLRPEAHEALSAQPWPGNVRELRNALDAAALRSGTVIGVEALALGPSPGSGSGRDGSLRAAERDAIEAALSRSGGNVSAAAKELGVGRATLHRRLRAYRLLAGEASIATDPTSGVR